MVEATRGRPADAAAPSPEIDGSRTSRTRRIFQLALRSVGGTVICVALVAAAGAGYEVFASSQDATRNPPPGRLVDVDGLQLHLNCFGQGGPTVVFDAGAGEIGSLAWGTVPAEVAADTRVCTYDRAGFGWSSPGPMPRTAGQVVLELHALLNSAGESGPFVLVGHSLGGKHMRLYAARYPDDVVGMVLVDARHEDVDSALGPEALQVELDQTKQFRELEVALRRLGITRALGPWLAGLAGPEVRDLQPFYFVQQGHPAAAEANMSEISSYVQSNAQLRVEAGTLGDMPLTILMRGKPIADPEYWSVWQASQRTLAKLSTRGRLIVAEDSGHTIQLEQPQLVVSAVRQTLTLAEST